MLMLHLQRQSLLSMRVIVQKRIMDAMTRLSNLQRYVSAIGSGSMNLSKIMGVPGRMAGRTLAFVAASHNQSVFDAKVQMMNPMMGAAMGMQIHSIFAQQGKKPNMMQQRQMMDMLQQQAFEAAYKQAREKCIEEEKENMKREEQKIMSEKTSDESQLAIIDQQLNGIGDAEKKNLEMFWKPSY